MPRTHARLQTGPGTYLGRARQIPGLQNLTFRDVDTVENLWTMDKDTDPFSLRYTIVRLRRRSDPGTQDWGSTHLGLLLRQSEKQA